MGELAKVRRVIARQLEGAPHETLLTIDATTGQNGLRQAQMFAAAAEVSGLVLTKLDGTARGGIALAIARELALPVKLIGVGESLEDSAAVRRRGLRPRADRRGLSAGGGGCRARYPPGTAAPASSLRVPGRHPAAAMTAPSGS